VGYRKLSIAEIENVTPAVVQNEMPDEPEALFLRWTVKNLITTPERARLFLRAKDYHVRPYGSGFNFALQKVKRDQDGNVLPPNPEAWRTLDPDSWDDLLYDFTDIFSEIAVGAATVAGGAFGGPLGAAGAAGAAELLRQGAGTLAGAEDNFDPLGAGVTAGLSGVAGPVGGALSRFGGAAIGQVVGKGRDLGLSLGAKIASFRSTPGLLAAEALSERAATMSARLTLPSAAPNLTGQVLQKGELPEAMHLVHILRARLDAIAQTGFPELKTTGLMRDAARNVTVPIKKAVYRLIRTQPLLTVDDAADAHGAHLLRERMMNVLGIPARQVVRVPGAGFASTPRTILRKMSPGERLKALKAAKPTIPQMHTILSHLDDYVAKRGGYDATKKFRADLFTRRVKNAATELREQIASTLGQPYRDLNSLASVKIATRNSMRDLVGEGVAGSEAFLQNIFKAGKSEARDLVTRFDALFGTDFMPYIRLAGVGQQTFSRATGRELFPRLTAVGQPLGVNLFSTGALAASASLGGYSGAAAGVALASPLGIVSLTRLAQGAFRGGEALGRGVGALAPRGSVRAGAARTAAYASVAASAREIRSRLAPDKPVAREGAQQRVSRGELLLR